MKTAIEVKVRDARWDEQRGVAVAWRQPGRRLWQRVWFTERTAADQFEAGLRAGRAAHLVLLDVWGASAPRTAADLGRLGAAAYQRNVSADDRKAHAKRAIKTRWKNYRAETAAIRALMAEAQQAGDVRQVGLCKRALGVALVDIDPDVLTLSVADARRECLRVIADAEAQV